MRVKAEGWLLAPATAGPHHEWSPAASVRIREPQRYPQLPSHHDFCGFPTNCRFPTNSVFEPQCFL